MRRNLAIFAFITLALAANLAAQAKPCLLYTSNKNEHGKVLLHRGLPARNVIEYCRLRDCRLWIWHQELPGFSINNFSITNLKDQIPFSTFFSA